MDFIAPELPQEVELYLQQYDSLFVRREMREHFRYYAVGLLSETRRKNVQRMMAKVVEGKYQSGHHFLADSPWDAEAVNRRRLALWQETEATRMDEKEGFFIQDDTGQERRLRGKEKSEGSNRLTGGTDGVARQYIGNVGKISEGMVFVSTHYADTKKRVPLIADLYWPKKARQRLPEAEQTDKRQRDKVDIAIDQLRWVNDDKNVTSPKPQRVLVDCWYGSSPRYLKAVDKDLKWTYIAAVRPNRKIFIRLPGEQGTPEHCVEEVITLFETGDFTKVLVQCTGGREKTKWVVEASKKHRVKVKRLNHRPRLFLCVDDPSWIDPEETEFLLCNDSKMSAVEVVQAYSLRNWEEVFYRQGKDELGLDQCEAHDEERLLRHWVLEMVTYTMLETFRVRGDLAQRSEKPLATFEAVIELLQDVFRWEFWMVWLRDEERTKRFIRWFCATRGLRISFAQSVT